MSSHPFLAKQNPSRAARIGLAKRVAIRRAVKAGALPDDWAEREYRLMLWHEQQQPVDTFDDVRHDLDCFGSLHPITPPGGTYTSATSQEDIVLRAAYRRWEKEQRERERAERDRERQQAKLQRELRAIQRKYAPDTIRRAS